MAPPFRRKPNRLPMPTYAGSHGYFLTVNSLGRREVFDPALTRFCIDKLRAAATRRQVQILAYCFMPNHLHLLALTPDEAFLPDFVRDFKQATGFEFKKRTKRQLWQKSYHDHVLRTEESIWDVALYIAVNPVRAGLVNEARDWPWTGSFVWERSALVEA